MADSFYLHKLNSKNVWNAEVEIPAEDLVGRFADDLDGYFFSTPDGVAPLEFAMKRM